MESDSEERPFAGGEERPWEPEPISQEDFTEPGGWSNINRAPYDRVSGTIYKRAANIKRVRYPLLDPAFEPEAPWQGQGEAVVRWLFSEQSDTEEGLLKGRAFQCLQDVRLLPGAITGQQEHPDQDIVLYVLEGEGWLHHRPLPASPVLTRPLRPGDAVLITAGELYSVANRDEMPPLRFIELRLGQL